MKILKTANKKTKIILSKKEWENIGKKAGWNKKIKTAMRLEDNISKDSVAVYHRGKEPYFIIDGCSKDDLDIQKVKDYLMNVDWTDRGARGWITPRLKCDDFLK